MELGKNIKYVLKGKVNGSVRYSGIEEKIKFNWIITIENRLTNSVHNMLSPIFLKTPWN